VAERQLLPSIGEFNDGSRVADNNKAHLNNGATLRHSNQNQRVLRPNKFEVQNKQEQLSQKLNLALPNIA
jgi:hypothetical protein